MQPIKPPGNLCAAAAGAEDIAVRTRIYHLHAHVHAVRWPQEAAQYSNDHTHPIHEKITRERTLTFLRRSRDGGERTNAHTHACECTYGCIYTRVRTRTVSKRISPTPMKRLKHGRATHRRARRSPQQARRRLCFLRGRDRRLRRMRLGVAVVARTYKQQRAGHSSGRNDRVGKGGSASGESEEWIEINNW